jgi:hypothetical protein
MIQYGQIIEEGYDPNTKNIYKSFVDYYNNPMMTKIKNVNGYSMYMIKIHAMLGNTYRYLIVFVSEDGKLNNTQIGLDKLEWVSFQTRTLEENHDILKHSYQPRKTYPLNQQIKLIDRDEDKSVYEAEDFKLVITLLHTKKGQKYQYQPNGTIVSSLETFQTIINFK